MNEETLKLVEVLLQRVREEQKVLNQKCNDLKKINDMITLGVSSFIAFKVLDVPTDPGIIPRQYYGMNLETTVHEFVSAVNEQFIIDAKRVVEQTLRIWLQRLQFVRGTMSEKHMLKMLEDSEFLSKDEQDTCDDREDILLD